MIRGFIFDVFELRSLKFPSPTVATALKKLRTFAGPKVPKIISLILSPFEGLFSRVLHTLMAQISRCHFGLDFLTFFEVAPNGSGICLLYTSDAADE